MSRTMLALKAASFCEGAASCLFLQFLVLHNRFSLGEQSLLVVSCLLAFPAVLIFFMNNFWGAFVDSTGGFCFAERIGLIGYGLCLLSLIVVESSGMAIVLVTGFSILYASLRPTLLSHATVLMEERRAGAISGILLFQSAGWFFSGILYGSLFKETEPWTVWIILGVPASISLAMAFLLPRWISDPQTRTDDAVPFAAVLRQGAGKVLLGDLKAIYRNPGLSRVCLVVFLTSTANWCFFGMFPVTYTEELGGDKSMQGWTISLSTITAFIVFPLIGRLIDRFGGRAGLVVCLVIYVVDYFLFCLIRSPIFATILFCVPVYPLFLVSANAVAAAETGKSQRAGGMGVMAGVMSISVASGSLLGGLVGDELGLRAIFFASVGVSALALVVFLLLVGIDGRNRKGEGSVR